jgi:hypothetical protein
MLESYETYHESRELPSFSLRQVDLPEIVKWQVGSKYYLVLKVEMTGVSNRSDLPEASDQGKLEGSFKMLSVRAVEDKPVDVSEIEKQDFNRFVAKVKSGEV